MLLGLSACSGGSDTPTPSPTPSPLASAEGLWIGTTGTNRTVTGVVLDDGTYWALYYSLNGPSSRILGFIQGDSDSQNGIFASSNAHDFNPDRNGILTAEIAGTYTTKQGLNGTIVYQNNVQANDTFTTTYNSEYESTPNIGTIAGIYTGPVALSETMTVTVSSAGEISGSSSTGCTITTGSVVPRGHGNVFNVTITFGPQDTCSNKNGTVNGVGFIHAGKLYSAAWNVASDRTNGVIFIGTKQ